jgi:hypothetical protein
MKAFLLHSCSSFALALNSSCSLSVYSLPGKIEQLSLDLLSSPFLFQ